VFYLALSLPHCEIDLDRYSSLLDPQYRFLLVGIVLLVMAVVFTLSGETVERFYGIVYRTEEPKRFWWDVAMFISVASSLLRSFCTRFQTETLPSNSRVDFRFALSYPCGFVVPQWSAPSVPSCCLTGL
jgi:hypothetical protein